MNHHERDVGWPSEFLRTSRNAFLPTFPHKYQIPARGWPGAQRYSYRTQPAQTRSIQPEFTHVPPRSRFFIKGILPTHAGNLTSKLPQ